LRQYWHSGQLNVLATGDLDHDGKLEIYLAGVNNARKAATLVVLDPASLAGASQEEPAYQLQALGTPVERARLLFPRSCINQRLDPYNVVMQLLVSGEGIIVDVREPLTSLDPPSVQHQLDRHLRSVGLALSDLFVAEHSRLQQSKQLDHAWSPAEAAALRAVVRVP
jgi:hypothetical protein